MKTRRKGTLDLRIQRQQAVAAFQRADFRAALRLARSLPSTARDDAAVLEIIGISAARLGRIRDAERALKKAIRLRPRQPSLHQALADGLAAAGRLDEAVEHYDQTLAVAPGATGAIAGKAAVLERRGDLAGASALIEPLLDAGPPDPMVAAVAATIDQAEGQYQASIDRALPHLSNPGLELSVRRRLCELVGKAFERTGEFDRAFEAFALSNRLIARPFDADAYVTEIDELIATFSPANLETLPRASRREQLPVFVASLPRSGSTLIEQIIHAHPDAYGAGEIADVQELVDELPLRLESLQPYPACLADLDARRADLLATGLLDELRRQDPRAKRVVNKHLENWRHLGLVALLLPGARVIHCRREPLDNCFSIYMAAMNTKVYPWATDLTHLGLVYRQHERLMRHWTETLELPVLDVRYEDVVADPERWIRAIIEFCGLPWDERCLRFNEAERDVMTLSYDQVRQPIYRTAVDRWRKYEDHLGPLKEALQGPP